jgi:hypothetical protein
VTPVEAFDLAIELTLTAPTEEKADQATRLAEEIALQMTSEQIEFIKSKYTNGEPNDF